MMDETFTGAQITAVILKSVILNYLFNLHIITTTSQQAVLRLKGVS